MKFLQEKLEKELKELLTKKEAQDILSKANWDDEQYTIRFKITNESVDRDGEVIKADGIDWKHFDKNPVILIDHKYTVASIAGKAINRETKGKDTFLDVQLAKGVPAGELVKTLHEQGMIKGVSIGFMPLERNPNDRSEITKSEALEASFVAIGSNREALIEDQKLYKKGLELGLIKEYTTEIVSAAELRTGDVVAYRFVRRFTEDGIEKVRVYPDTSKLPKMGKIIQKLEWGEEILTWSDKIIIGKKEDPVLTIQAHVASEDGPKTRTQNIGIFKYSELSIERIVPNKEIEKTVEDMKKELSDEEIDMKSVFNIVKEIQSDVAALKKQDDTPSDDNDSEKDAEIKALKKKKAQDLAKAVSGFLEVEKM